MAKLPEDVESVKLPEDVELVKLALLRDPSHDLNNIAGKLLAATPKLLKMWRTLEKRKVGPDDFWVWTFLHAAADASNLPPYHYKSARERRHLSNTITSLAKRLVGTLEVNGLDWHLIHSDGKLFNGFLIYEDFGESNQSHIDALLSQKLKFSKVIRIIAERSKQQIAEEPLRGKAGSNAQAIRFIRLIAARNKRYFCQPLNEVTATAANVIFGTSYKVADIRKLLSR